MCVPYYCQNHFTNYRLKVEELGKCDLNSFTIKPAYDIPFPKNSFVAYKCDKFLFKCAIGTVKSIVNGENRIWFIIRPIPIKSTILDKFSVNSNERILNLIKENTMFDYYFCLEEYLPKNEMTAYRPMSYFIKEKNHLVIVDIEAIIYKCLIISTPGQKSYCCPIIAPSEHN